MLFLNSSPKIKYKFLKKKLNKFLFKMLFLNSPLKNKVQIFEKY